MQEIPYVAQYRDQLTRAIRLRQHDQRRRRLMVVLATAVIGAAIAGAGTVAALRSAPPSDGTIGIVREGYRGYDRLPSEPDPKSIEEQATEVVASPSGPYLLQAAIGRNPRGGQRALFTLFEIDPDVSEWRPVEGIEMDLAGVTAYVQDVPDAGAFLGFVGAPDGAEVEYLTESGQWKPLQRKGPAGFVGLPPDASDPPELRAARD